MKLPAPIIRAWSDVQVNFDAIVKRLSGTIIDTQRLSGNNNAYKAPALVTENFFTNGATGPLQLVFTPKEDCWWEVHANIGILQKTDAAYNYAYGQLSLSPPDADGYSAAPNILTQHATVDDYGFRSPSRIWKLKAGVTYTCVCLFSSSGGTWQYYQGGDYLFIEGKAWRR